MTESIEVISDRDHLHWSAIWAGVFVFFAIWSVFGALCLAIFAGSASMGLALEVWGVILTIIAMFIAGRATAQWSGVTESRHTIMQSMVMFGLAVISVILVVATGTAMLGALANGVSLGHGSVAAMFSDYGWALFVALFLGWLAAMGGASSAHRMVSHPEMQHQIGHA